MGAPVPRGIRAGLPLLSGSTGLIPQPPCVGRTDPLPNPSPVATGEGLSATSLPVQYGVRLSIPPQRSASLGGIERRFAEEDRDWGYRACLRLVPLVPGAVLGRIDTDGGRTAPRFPSDSSHYCVGAVAVDQAAPRGGTPCQTFL
jgi:hypothetical protein